MNKEHNNCCASVLANYTKLIIVCSPVLCLYRYELSSFMTRVCIQLACLELQLGLYWRGNAAKCRGRKKAKSFSENDDVDVQFFVRFGTL